MTSCLHNPEQPFREPNSINNNRQTIKKTASTIFSDLLFDSPMGEMTFCSVKFSYDAKDDMIKSITQTMKSLIQKENSIYYASNRLKEPTFTISFSTKQKRNQQTIKVDLIQNSSKQKIYTRNYPIKN
jgi:hypothetical protein